MLRTKLSIVNFLKNVRHVVYGIRSVSDMLCTVYIGVSDMLCMVSEAYQTCCVRYQKRIRHVVYGIRSVSDMLCTVSEACIHCTC